MAKDGAYNSNVNQDPEDKHGPKYDNDASGWLRGATGVPTGKNETAENKPSGFDKGNAWRKGREGINHGS